MRNIGAATRGSAHNRDEIRHPECKRSMREIAYAYDPTKHFERVHAFLLIWHRRSGNRSRREFQTEATAPVVPAGDARLHEPMLNG